MLKCRHQCHCACTSEIKTGIINETGRQAAHTKNNENKRVVFGRITSNDVLYSWFEGLQIKKNFKKNTKLTGTICVRTTQFQFCIKYYWFKFLIYNDSLDTLKISICFYHFIQHFQIQTFSYKLLLNKHKFPFDRFTLPHTHTNQKSSIYTF